jgi:hypothetical protein
MKKGWKGLPGENIFTQNYFEMLANSEIACLEIFLLSNGFSGAHDNTLAYLAYW